MSITLYLNTPPIKSMQESIALLVDGVWLIDGYHQLTHYVDTIIYPKIEDTVNIMADSLLNFDNGTQNTYGLVQLANDEEILQNYDASKAISMQNAALLLTPLTTYNAFETAFSTSLNALIDAEYLSFLETIVDDIYQDATLFTTYINTINGEII